MRYLALVASADDGPADDDGVESMNVEIRWCLRGVHDANVIATGD
jgi:hypothetical protein